ncbi:TetR family transcriptional regulator [Nemorincola caseinilytica]|uniref:TetR family transcriptional regulator n=1 Tax=Nemorincola caseinilytica TaxID=2054315 RepID=A0ABP8N4C5_9BACT
MEFSEKQLSIIAAAERLFSVNGFEGTSVRDIANEAGVNVAMISYYFGSKEKLMEAVFEEKTKKMRLKVENLLQDTKMTTREKVNILLEDYVEKFLSNPQFHKIMLLEQIVDKPGGVADLILGLKKRNHISIKKLILEGQKKGEFKKNIDVVLMMSTLVGVVSQMIIARRFYREVNNLEHLSEEEYNNYIRKKLTVYLKNLFKMILTNEA